MPDPAQGWHINPDNLPYGRIALRHDRLPFTKANMPPSAPRLNGGMSIPQ